MLLSIRCLSEQANAGSLLAIQSPSVSVSTLIVPDFSFSSLVEQKAFRIFCNAERESPNQRVGKRVV